jgi:pimeloyl-ACP methyl ester carboxylesterase
MKTEFDQARPGPKCERQARDSSRGGRGGENVLASVHFVHLAILSLLRMPACLREIRTIIAHIFGHRAPISAGRSDKPRRALRTSSTARGPMARLTRSGPMRIAISLAIGAGMAIAAPSPAPARGTDLGANLERFAYPLPVKWFEASSQGHPVRMAYLDVQPTAPSRNTTIVLLHGKNFCAATWAETATALAAQGYRVIAPDQVGFCKSSKPPGYQYSFHALAELTRALLDRAGTGKIVLVGHSTGGILAIRFALLHPDRVSRLVLVNPLGLNDTLAEGVPYADLGALRAEEAKTNAASIRAYQLRNYYHGNWRPAYDRWVEMLAGQYASAGGDIVRDAQARLSDMIQTQPVADALPRLTVPLTLIIGELDTTAFRANTAPAERRARVRTVPKAADEAVRRVPGARLIRLEGLGHAPQVESPARFQQALIQSLDP